VKSLWCLDLSIGFVPDVEFQDAALEISANSSLYIFSDGAYEIHQANGKLWGMNAFIDFLINCTNGSTDHLQEVLGQITTLNSHKILDDDLSLLKVKFD
jgi:phosphoserine phosphatase RsbU/P